MNWVLPDADWPAVCALRMKNAKAASRTGSWTCPGARTPNGVRTGNAALPKESMLDLDFAFAHRTEICKPFTRKYTDAEAPYDGYVEDDDTEEKARTGSLKKKETLK